MSRVVTYGLVAGLAAFSAYVIPPLSHNLKVFGVWRGVPESTIPNFIDYNKVPDTVHCEDVHHYLPANLLFAACEDSHVRFSWFPPLESFDPPPEGTQGSLRVIDPTTMKSTRLAFENFDKPFVTHGIDVIEDPKAKDAVYIFAVNHQPNPEWAKARKEGVQKSNSRIELFRYVLGLDTVRHVRTISHPLIKTPNDIYALSPTSLYITNDHENREGFWRTVETLWPMARWSNIVYVSISDLATSSPTEGLDVSVALTGLKNNNGLGHVHVRGEHSGEILIASAEGGILYLARANEDHTLRITDTIPLDSTLDNPSYYSDPYATAEDDASGYVLAGLARGIDLAGNAHDPDGRDPPFVWFVRRGGRTKDARESSSASTEEWEKRLIFSDDGTRIRSASAAVIVPIDPKLEGGTKKGWLFITGFLSENMISTKIDL